MGVRTPARSCLWKVLLALGLLPFFGKAATLAQTSDFRDAVTDIKVPDLLDCDAFPEWRAFRLATIEAVASGFAQSAELQQQAASLERAWRPRVCRDASGACRSTADLSFDFVRDLQYECRSSNNFDRYLVRHYFTNTGEELEPLQEQSGFCLYGYLMALVVLAWHALPDSVGEFFKHIYTAQHLLGHYHSFDYLESSSWPVTSFLVLINLQAGGGFVPLLEPPDYGHPGQHGTAWYLQRLAWANTTEAAKQNPGAAPFLPLPFDPLPPNWRGRGGGARRPRLSVWQFCIHTSTAGEAVTMISRFLSDSYEVEFRGNSIAFQLCGNYEPSLCARGRNAEFLDWLADRFIAKDTSYDALSQEFRKTLLPELLQADVWMCSIPAVWCRLLAEANAARGLEEKQRPIFAYLGLPILQYVVDEGRQEFLAAFAELVLDPRNIVVANNPYLSEEVAWQTGLRVPTLRIHGLHTNSTYLPLHADEVLVSRPGTSGGWQECILNQFMAANPGYPVRFVQFTDLLNPHTTQEVYNNSLSYANLAQYRAVVSFPYDTSLMFFWEFYSMCVPIYVPFQLWRWGIFGQHTRPDLADVAAGIQEQAGGDDRPPYPPFFDGFAPLDLEAALYWAKFTDWAMFPHVQYFKSIPELMVGVVQVDLQAVSAAMKRFNEASIVQTVATWRYVVERWLDLETLT